MAILGSARDERTSWISSFWLLIRCHSNNLSYAVENAQRNKSRLQLIRKSIRLVSVWKSYDERWAEFLRRSNSGTLHADKKKLMEGRIWSSMYNVKIDKSAPGFVSLFWTAKTFWLIIIIIQLRCHLFTVCPPSLQLDLNRHTPLYANFPSTYGCPALKPPQTAHAWPLT